MIVVVLCPGFSVGYELPHGRHVLKGMRTIPTRAERGDDAALVLRTDYSDDAGWQGVLAALEEGDTSEVLDEPLPWSYVVIQGSEWDGASVDDVISVVVPDEYLPVVFVADKQTTAGPEHLFLAVTAKSPEDESYQDTIEYGRVFRILPGQMPGLHANLDLANMDFQEFAAVAQNDPEGVFRGFD